MTFDELLAKASSEADRVVQIGAAGERRMARCGHLFSASIDINRLEAWTQQWPRHLIPEDLKQLLRRANGIHLWADLETGRAYEGLAPLEEWDLARRKMWGADASPDSLGDEYLAISYHTDGAAYWVLKVTTGEYFLMDACGADEACLIGSNVSHLLDWVWDHRIER